MVCSKCGRAFCWLCMAKLPDANPYSHFQDPKNEKCYMNLMLGIIGDSDDEEDVNGDMNDVDDDDWGGGWLNFALEENGNVVLEELREVIGAAVALLDRP